MSARSLGDIPEEMVETAARVIDPGGVFASTPRIAREVLSAALAGYAVVALPAPDDTNERLGALVEWSVPGGVIGVYGDGLGGGRPVYASMEGGHMSTADAEVEGAALIAAARWRSESAQ